MVEIETPEKIHQAIEKKLSLGASYIDALVEYANERDIEIETVASIVKKSSIMKEKIREEAKNMRLIKKDDNESNIFE